MPDSSAALEAVRVQANAGDVEAQYIFARVSELGVIGPADWPRAAHLYSMASEKGHVGAMLSLAAMYFAGRGVTQDCGTSAKLYQRAAQLGSDAAKVALADQYFEGAGVDRKAEMAVTLLMDAANGRYKYAYTRIGEGFLSGQIVASRPVPEAYAWFAVAAKAGDSVAGDKMTALAAKMSLSDLSEGRERALELLNKYDP